MWLGLAKMALQTGAKVYANKQRTKQAMSDAALLTAEKQARGEIEYNGKQPYDDEVIVEGRDKAGEGFPTKSSAT